MPTNKPSPRRKSSTSRASSPSARRRTKKRNAATGPFLIVMFIVGFFALVYYSTDITKPSFAPPLEENEIRVSFLDVGQGDSILIQSKDNAVLIDGGEYTSRYIIVDALRNAGVKTLDYIIATHPHSDHIGGLPEVINQFAVKEVLMPGVTHNTTSFESLLIAIEDNNIPLTIPALGQRFSAGIIQLTVTAPVKGPYDNMNNDSLVVKLIHGQNAFLFAGDAEQISERDMVATGANLRAQVLKAGHHGSRTSTSDIFLDAVNPHIVVISCAKNNQYEHPHPETLERLEQREGIAHVLRTDELGTIVISTNGQRIVMLR